jgi:glycosyltransferase involved in cell wall biosynthesis
VTPRFEIVVVDDGSTDTTVDQVLAFAQIHPIRLIKFSRNFGKETALTAGLEHSRGDVVIILDADFQHPLELIPVFLQKWSEGYDMVYGVRTNRDDETRIKRFLANCFYGFLSKITKTHIPYGAGDFRLLDRKVVNALNQCEERGRFMKGLYGWVGFKSVAVPFTVQKRIGGNSSWKLGRLTELALTGITLFSDVPLRVWSFIGFIVSLIAFFYALYITTITLIFGVDVPGFATIVVAVMFFGGIQLLSIGILGEYLARVFNEVKQRPKYIVESTFGFSDRQ